MMDVFTIGMVAKMTGLTEFTLRAWEKRYEVAKPSRSESGRRVYSLKEVEKLKLLKLLTEGGHSIGQIAHLETPKLTSLLRQGDRHSGTARTIATVLAAIEACDLSRLSAHLKTTWLERDTRSFLVEIVSPVMAEVGRRVNDGRLDVYHEHAASALIRNLLSGILYSLEQLPRTQESAPVVFATPEGDHHEFGILISAILTALRGVKVYYLGPNMPVRSLAKALKNLKAGAVVIGCAAPRDTLSTADWKEFVTQLSASIDTDIQFWFGGERTGEIEGIPSLKRREVRVMNRYQDFEKALGEFHPPN